MKEGDTNTKMSSTRPRHHRGVTPIIQNPPRPLLLGDKTSRKSNVVYFTCKHFSFQRLTFKPSSLIIDEASSQRHSLLSSGCSLVSSSDSRSLQTTRLFSCGSDDADEKSDEREAISGRSSPDCVDTSPTNGVKIWLERFSNVLFKIIDPLKMKEFKKQQLCFG